MLNSFRCRQTAAISTRGNLEENKLLKHTGSKTQMRSNREEEITHKTQMEGKTEMTCAQGKEKKRG